MFPHHTEMSHFTACGRSTQKREWVVSFIARVVAPNASTNMCDGVHYRGLDCLGCTGLATTAFIRSPTACLVGGLLLFVAAIRLRMHACAFRDSTDLIFLALGDMDATEKPPYQGIVVLDASNVTGSR